MAKKCGKGGPRSREHAIDDAAARAFAVLARLHHTGRDDLIDKRVAYIGDGCSAVEAPLLLHLADDALDRDELVRLELEGGYDPSIAFDDLGRCKAHGDIGLDSVILDEMHDAVERPMDRPAMVVLIAEILSSGTLLVHGHVQRVIDKLVDALVLCRRDGHDGYAEHALHLVHADRAAVALDLIHHVEGQHHRAVEFHELHREIEVAPDVGCIDDVDDAARLLAEDEPAADDLFLAIGAHGVDARQVGDVGIGMSADDAVLTVDGDAGEVAHTLIGAGELVVERGFPAVLITDKREGERGSLGQRVLGGLHMIASALAEAGVLRGGMRRRSFLLRAHPDGLDGDLICVRHAEGELVSMDEKLHGIAHRRELHERDLGFGDDAHVEEVLAQRPLSPNGGDADGLADPDVRERRPLPCHGVSKVVRTAIRPDQDFERDQHSTVGIYAWPDGRYDKRWWSRMLSAGKQTMAIRWHGRIAYKQRRMSVHLSPAMLQ